MRAVALTSERGEPAASIRMGGGLSIRVDYAADRVISPVLASSSRTTTELSLFGSTTDWSPDSNSPAQRGRDRLRASFAICRSCQTPMRSICTSARLHRSRRYLRRRHVRGDGLRRLRQRQASEPGDRVDVLASDLDPPPADAGVMVQGRLWADTTRISTRGNMMAPCSRRGVCCRICCAWSRRARSSTSGGCVGTWLKAAAEWVVDDLAGPMVPMSIARTADSTRTIHRGRSHEAFTVPRTFDAALSLEVAEHLPEASAASFVDSLTRLAPVVLFSAAIRSRWAIIT